MSEIYRKAGRSVRWENGVVVRVAEAGIAIDDGSVFWCEADGDAKAAAVPPQSDTVVAVATRIREMVAPHAIERLIVAYGEASHDCDGRVWSERSERIHLAIVRERLRVLVDLASFELGDIECISRALDRAENDEREQPGALRLAPNVAAALIAQAAPEGITIVQRAGGIDGKGFSIVETPGANWFRPSYRVRPVRVPMHVEARCESVEMEDVPRAIALLAPPRGTVLRVLVDDGQSVRPATIDARRVRAVGGPSTFYPYGAGSFGAEMML